MDKKLCDACWQCLSKEAREEVKIAFNMPSKCGYSDSVRLLLSYIFGHHNLTSNAEPSELLFVERAKVIDLYAAMDKAFPREAAYSVQSALQALFGDKCMPDTTVAENATVTSAQGEPKKFFESDYCIGDKVVICISSIGEPRKEVVTLLRQYQPQCEYSDYAKTWVVQTQDGMTYQSNEEHFEPYTEPETKVPDNRKILYDALCELESASAKVRKALIFLQ